MTQITDKIARRMLEIFADEGRWRNFKSTGPQVVGIVQYGSSMDIRGCTIAAARDVGQSYADSADVYGLIVKLCLQQGRYKSVDTFNYDSRTTIHDVRALIEGIIGADKPVTSEDQHVDEEFSADLFPATPEIPLVRSRFAD